MQELMPSFPFADQKKKKKKKKKSESLLQCVVTPPLCGWISEWLPCSCWLSLTLTFAWCRLAVLFMFFFFCISLNLKWKKQDVKEIWWLIEIFFNLHPFISFYFAFEIHVLSFLYKFKSVFVLRKKIFFVQLSFAFAWIGLHFRVKLYPQMKKELAAANITSIQFFCFSDIWYQVFSAE